MAGQGDLQELLRMLTSRRVSIMAAMGHFKALQAEKLLRYVSRASSYLRWHQD